MQFQLALFLAAGLAAAEGQGLGLILGIGFIGSVVALVASCLGGFGERSIAGVKVSLVLAVICGLSYLIVQALFTSGGIAPNINPVNQ